LFRSSHPDDIVGEVIEMLRQTRGALSGPSGAAARLGLKRTTLQSNMQKLGIARLHHLNWRPSPS